MFRRRRFLFVTVGTFSVFLLSTLYLILILPKEEIEVNSKSTIEEKIYFELKNLRKVYAARQDGRHEKFETFLKNIKNVSSEVKQNLTKVWKKANSWLTKTQVVNLTSSDLGNVIYALKNSKIVKADLDTRGTQLKLLLTLQGGQQVVFKPQWYEKTRIIDGPVYAGKDRHSSEILAFHLSAVFDKPLTPLSVERKISLANEIKPVATNRLLETMFEYRNETCVYGKCFFCKREDPVCDRDSHLNGAVIFNLKVNLNNHRSPWQRTYRKGKKATWQMAGAEESYCDTVKQKLSRKRLYDLIDLSIFDFLIQNGDRHHYETFGESVIWLDNGKGLGNPFTHHLDILAPLYQCCILRRETWKTLMGLSGGALGEKLRSIEEVRGIVMEDHLKAIESRLLMVFAAIEYCKNQKKFKETNTRFE